MVLPDFKMMQFGHFDFRPRRGLHCIEHFPIGSIYIISDIYFKMPLHNFKYPLPKFWLWAAHPYIIIKSIHKKPGGGSNLVKAMDKQKWRAKLLYEPICPSKSYSLTHCYAFWYITIDKYCIYIIDI